jgi:hypothetical protein
MASIVGGDGVVVVVVVALLPVVLRRLASLVVVRPGEVQSRTVHDEISLFGFIV